MRTVIGTYKETFGRDFEKMRLLYSHFFRDPRHSAELKAEVALIGEHQARLNDIHKQRKYAQEAIRTLAEAKLWDKQFDSFTQLYDTVEELIGGIPFIGSLTIYDVAVRISARFSIEPEKVYLNAGAKEGARVLLGVTKIDSVVDISIFGETLSQLTSIHIENFLCIYKKVISKGGVKKGEKLPAYNKNRFCGIRKGLLIYEIFIEQKITVTSKLMSY